MSILLLKQAPTLEAKNHTSRNCGQRGGEDNRGKNVHVKLTHARSYGGELDHRKSICSSPSIIKFDVFLLSHGWLILSDYHYPNVQKQTCFAVLKKGNTECKNFIFKWSPQSDTNSHRNDKMLDHVSITIRAQLSAEIISKTAAGCTIKLDWQQKIMFIVIFSSSWIKFKMKVIIMNLTTSPKLVRAEWARGELLDLTYCQTLQAWYC